MKSAAVPNEINLLQLVWCTSLNCFGITAHLSLGFIIIFLVFLQAIRSRKTTVHDRLAASSATIEAVNSSFDLAFAVFLFEL